MRLSVRSFRSLSSITKNTISRRIKLIPLHPCFIRINAIVITNTVIRTFDFANQLRVVKKYVNDAVLFVQENTHEVYKHCVQANLDGSSVAKKY